MIGERGVMQETMFLVSASSAPNHLLRATDRSLSTYSRHHASLRPFLASPIHEAGILGCSDCVQPIAV
jgi:hypothetical protein